MELLNVKSPAERNKLIIAAVLGVIALISLYFAFGRGLFSGGSSTAAVSATPAPTRTAGSTTRQVRVPTIEQQNSSWLTTPIEYHPGNYGSPDAGRNIFAFYEPPPPGSIPTQPPTQFQTPVPTPTPPMFIAYVAPQSIYAGGRTFRLEINGDKFSRDTRVYFSQIELPTTFISEQRLAAEVPANMIRNEGPRQIIVQTPNGKSYSNQLILTIQPPPKPDFQYVGVIARRMGNNDTAVFREEGKNTEFSARLNDIILNRFRVVSISSDDVVLEDVNLGFRHKLELFRPPPGTLQSTLPAQPGFQRGRGFDPSLIQGFPQGIPGNVQRVPANTAQPQKDTDEDDEDGENKP